MNEREMEAWRRVVAIVEDMSSETDMAPDDVALWVEQAANRIATQMCEGGWDGPRAADAIRRIRKAVYKQTSLGSLSPEDLALWVERLVVHAAKMSDALAYIGGAATEASESLDDIRNKLTP